jgi:hypothetical protein
MRVRVIPFLAVALLAGGSGAAASSRGHAIGAAGPVPAGTTATSVSFVSTHEAFVLGTAPCAHRPCSVILRTLDRGHSWQGLAAPRQRVSLPEGSGLWGLRFADAQRGYAYGRGIWRTTDGASSWQRWSVPGRYVIDFAAVRDSELIAVTSPCTSASSHCPNRLTLYHRAVAGGRWRRVASSGRQAFNESISVSGGVVWVLIGQRLLVSADDGRTFSAHSQPCASTVSGLPQPTSITDGGSTTFLLCTGQGALSHTVKKVFRTHGVHSGWTLIGRAPFAGDAGTLAAAGNRRLVLATASAASWLYSSSDAGKHWGTSLFYGDGGLGWSDLGFTTSSDGVVIHAPARTDGGSPQFPGQLILTEDGGHTWHTVAL